MATLAEDIATFLLGNSLIQGYGIDCFSDFLPEQPDHLVCMYESPSDPVSPYLEEVHRSLQFVTRDKNPDVAKALALSIFSLLRKEDLRVDFTPARFGQVHIREIPFKLKTDENDRTLYCFNIGITTTID